MTIVGIDAGCYPGHGKRDIRHLKSTSYDQLRNRDDTDKGYLLNNLGEGRLQTLEVKEDILRKLYGDPIRI